MLTVLVVGALFVAPALSSAQTTVGPFHERDVARVLATPTPVGPATLLDDRARWLVDVPSDLTVLVMAQGAPHAPFFLRHHREHQAEPDLAFPGASGALVLPGPSRWIVTLDPAGGAQFRARVTFQGFVSDVGGAGGSFAVTDLRDAAGCVVPGVCLP